MNLSKFGCQKYSRFQFPILKSLQNKYIFLLIIIKKVERLTSAKCHKTGGKNIPLFGGYLGCFPPPTKAK